MQVKSVITSPAPGGRLPVPGFYELRGLAWSGAGRIARVDVSIDGGASWNAAALDPGAQPMALTAFAYPLRWDGSPIAIASRATDETGAVQPALADVIARNGPSLRYHVNAIARWSIADDGIVTNIDG
jgi:sulfane dehydrogenase subunit SoxC